jgi:hypothetical protein
MTAVRDIDPDEPPEEHFPSDIRSPEARSLYRLVSKLGTGLSDHATRMERRFEGVEASLANFIGGVRLEFDSMRKPASVPPVRKESPSSAAFLEDANVQVVEKLREMARATPGPTTHVEAKPEDLAAAVRPVVAHLFQERENANNARFLATQRRIVWVALVAFVTATSGGFGAWAWGKAQGHAEGFVEGKTHKDAP